MNKTLLKEEIIRAENGNVESRAVVREVLKPRKTDSVEQIQEKILIFIRLIFLSSLKYKDAKYHKQIDRFYAEQIHSYLAVGKPRYKGGIFIGFRESAKSTRIRFCETYISLYLPEFSDFVNFVSEDGGESTKAATSIFNIFGFSRVQDYFPHTLELSHEKSGKKTRQTMSYFSTRTGVTYGASAARKSKRGNLEIQVDDDKEVDAKRPKRVIFDDIENESTLLSNAATEEIYSVMGATIDGLDQMYGFWVIVGNYLSLRGNIAKYLKKYEDDQEVFTLMIPILDDNGAPTWPDKYVSTDAEARDALDAGKLKRSIESIQRDSDNFETEYQNNPRRNLVYFDDSLLKGFDDTALVSESERDEAGLLTIEEPEDTGTYVMAVDCAGGVGQDESAFSLLKVDGLWYEEVANFKSKRIRPEDYAPYSANIARKYNNALIIPENNYPGNEYIAFLRQVYNNIFVSETKREKDGTETKIYGVNTNLKTKPEMFSHAKKVFKQRLFKPKSRETYRQISEYPSNEVLTVRQRDGSGGHFDLLMATVICLWKANVISEEKGSQDAINEVVERINRDSYDDTPTHAW